MKKIASPNELQAEIRSIIAFVHGHGPEGKPDREAIAGKLRDLADRVAAGPTLKVKDVGTQAAKGSGEHLEMDISGTVGGVGVKGRMRRVSLGLDDITARVVDDSITVNKAEGGALPSGVRKKVVQAVLKKLEGLQKAWEKKNR